MLKLKLTSRILEDESTIGERGATDTGFSAGSNEEQVVHSWWKLRDAMQTL